MGLLQLSGCEDTPSGMGYPEMQQWLLQRERMEG